MNRLPNYLIIPEKIPIMKHFILSLGLTMTMLIPFDLQAQWTTQTNVNTLVSTAQTDDIKSLGTSDGKTWVVFWKQVPSTYYEMWAQLLDVNGDTLLGPQGMLVNNVVSMSSYTTVWYIAIDEWDNLYITFNGTGSSNTVYVHKISTAGIQLWGANGVAVGTGFDPKVLPLLDGSAIVSWLPGNQGVFTKINSNGTLAWTNPITIQPGISGHYSSAGELLAHPNGDITILIHDRASFSPSSTFYAQRYSSSGSAIWSAPIALANIGTSYNRRYTAVVDQDTVYLGYSGALGLVFYSYLQRINPNGTLPWGINGVDFSTQTTNYELDTKIAFSSSSEYIWAICEFSNSGQSLFGEYVQKFDKSTGARMLTNNAKQVFAISNSHNYHAGSLQLVNDQPIFIISNGYNNGALPIDLWATLLDSLGNFAWPTQTVNLATYSSFKSRVDFSRNVAGQSVAVWCENRGSGSRIYAQNVTVCISPIASFTYNANHYTVDFTNTCATADSVYWDFGDGISSVLFNPTHVYQDTGYYTVCEIAKNNCGSDTVCQLIHITCPIPQAGFTWTSNGYAVDFLSNSVGADTVIWDFGDGVVGVGFNVNHTYQDTGTYQVCQIAQNSCGADTLCQSIVVICPFPQAAFVYSISGLILDVISQSIDADTVFWDFGDGNIGGGFIVSHTYTTPGTYQVCEIAQNSCGSDTLCQIILINNSSIEEDPYKAGIRIYPNPTEGIFWFEIPWDFSNITWKIIDVQGQVVIQGKVDSNQKTFEVNAESLVAGVYHVQVLVDEQIIMGTICITEP